MIGHHSLADTCTPLRAGQDASRVTHFTAHGTPHSPARLSQLRDPSCCWRNWGPRKAGGQIRLSRVAGLQRSCVVWRAICRVTGKTDISPDPRRNIWWVSIVGLFHLRLCPGGVCTCGLSGQELVLSGPGLFVFEVPWVLLSLCDSLGDVHLTGQGSPVRPPFWWVSPEYPAWHPKSWVGPQGCGYALRDTFLFSTKAWTCALVVLESSSR